jgi:hypothetical protein
MQLINIAGILLILLSLLHVIFPQYFKWKQELSTLSFMNREMMYVHSFFIALTVMMMGILCVTSANEMLTTPFGKRISLALAIFWTIRLVIQFFGYSQEIWKGKRFETFVHVFFSMLWIYLAGVFYWAYRL